MPSPEPMVMCPVCRQAYTDREYYKHSQTHQSPRPVVDCPKGE